MFKAWYTWLSIVEPHVSCVVDRVDAEELPFGQKTAPQTPYHLKRSKNPNVVQDAQKLFWGQASIGNLRSQNSLASV
jgi:hypothetical protein